MNKYILTIDNGLTKSKAIIIDLNGKEIATSVINSNVNKDNSHAEINMEEQWLNTTQVIKKVIKKANIDSTQIVGIGNTAHGAGLYMIDEKGKPVRNAFSSMDDRGIDILNKWEKEEINVFDKTYQHMWNGQPIPYLYWLKKNEPKNFKKIDKILMAKDWIKYKLTDNIVTDYSDASNSGLLNARTKSYDISIFKRFGLESIYKKLPEIKDSDEIIGKVTKKAAKETNLKEGTPVVNGFFDVVACTVGSGVYTDERYSLVSGTWSINAGVANDIKPNKNIMTWSVFAEQDKYLYFDASPTAAVNLEWYINNIIKSFELKNLETKDIYKKIESKMKKIDPNDVNIIYTPFIYQSNLSKKLKGTFLGIDAANNTYDLIRAIHEGVVFAHLKHIENLKKGGIIKDKAVLSGGVTNSNFWCQLFADILDIEIITTDASQIGALGAAIITGIGINEFKNINDGVNVMVNEKNRFHPRADYKKIYLKRYKKFKHLIEIMDNNF